MRLELSPVEGLAHEGFVTKRVREEGGGYRFVFQAVVEYLVYRHLADGRPAGEAEEAYWARRAAPVRVFPEYADAFAFLLRDWAAQGRLEQAGPLVEASPTWLGDVMTTFLVEQARTGHWPGKGSPAAERAAHALSKAGGEGTASALFNAAFQLANTRFAPAAATYYQACVAIREALSAANPDNVGVGDGLGSALNNLGLLLCDAGRAAEAARAFRRSVEIREALWAANPDNVEIAAGYAGSLCSVGRWASSQRLVDAVLRLVPTHPYANQLKRYIEAQRPGG